MKKKLLATSVAAFCALSTNAQTLFTQNFSSSTAVADYIRIGAPTPIAIGDNMFTNIGQRTGTPAAPGVATIINNGKLRISRNQDANVGTNNYNSYGAAAGRTIQKAGANAALASTAPTALKVSFELTVADFVINQNNSLMLSIGGATLNNEGYSAFGANGGHSILGVTTLADNTYKFSRPSADATSGSGVDLTTAAYATGSTQNITWFVNNSGSSLTYTGPDAVSHILANDTWDLFVGTVRVLAGRAAINTENDLNSFVFYMPTIWSNGTPTNNAAVTFDIDNVVFEDLNVVLPVTLSSFTGNSTTLGNVLKWQTASEQSNSHFEVLRSTNGNDFSAIGTVKGNGTSTTINNYQFVDKKPTQGVNYYKLKQVDVNGNTTENKEFVALKGINANAYLNVLATESQVRLTFDAEKASKANLKIYNINGRTILNKETIVQAGVNRLSYPANLAKGVYIAAVNTNGQVVKSKFVK